MKIKSKILLGILLGLMLQACGTQRLPQPKIVDQIQIQNISRSTTQSTTSNEKRIHVEVVVDRARLLQEEFLYGADLQTSTHTDEDLELYDKALTWGHVAVRFRVRGNELQLIAPQLLDFPGDSNHPERLISRFTILNHFVGEDGREKLTISVAHSGVQLATVTQELTGNEELGDVKDTWVRTFEYAQDADLILQQTSILLKDGTIAEYLESIFPAARLAPSNQFNAQLVTESNGRFGFIPSASYKDGEEDIEYASHYDLAQEIEWYATRNTPNDMMPIVAAGIEGWNRYFKEFKGIGRDVLKFKGHLPEGIHMGDPRFNVVVWDSRLDAGAAYESQASDRLTGKQSHSLIYLPAGWLTIGTDYWKDGRASDLAGALDIERKKTKSRRRCARDLRDARAFLLTQKDLLNGEEVREFALQLLKQTLFHEMGHALGLEHNFKGSLKFPTQSIMDYNAFDLERFTFSGLESAAGPELEYDRQALSALYNQSKDLESTNVELPYCNDDDADALEEGIDPLCVRYDQGHDPSLSMERALDRLEKTDLGVSRIADRFLPQEYIKEIQTHEQFKAVTERMENAYAAHLRYFIGSGNASMRKTLSVGARGLLMYAEGALEDSDLDEHTFRARIWKSIRRALAIKSLSPKIWSAVDADIAKSKALLMNTPYFKSTLAGIDRAQWPEDFINTTQANAEEVESEDFEKGLIQSHAEIIEELAYKEEVPFYLGTQGRALLDYEAIVLAQLETLLIGDWTRPQVVRLAAATALGTFNSRAGYAPLRSRLRKKLTQERDSARDNTVRENAYALIKAVKL